MPSELEDLSWNVTLADIRFKLSTRLSVENLHGVQMFQACAEVAAAVFGGNKKESIVSDVSEENVPKTSAEAIAMFSRVMNG